MLSFLALLVLGAGVPNGAALYSVDPGASRLTYRIVHKLHEVDAESKAVEAKATLAADGTVQVMARAAVASFKSGDANRDEHMLEVVESGAHPFVTLKAVGHADVPTALPATTTVALACDLDFHGVHSTERFPVTIDVAADGTAHVTGSFNVSLDKYKVDRPSLLFVKVDDACLIKVDLTLKRTSP